MPSILAATTADIPTFLVLPFVLLLMLIAVMPAAGSRTQHFWEAYHRHVSIGLGAFVAVYYLISIAGGRELLLHTVHEYVSFIVLIGSLFVVAGGIHLDVKGEATPWVNVLFLAAGALAANVIGTTGASMVLIRPWIRMNKIRISAFHVVFFIFVVSNVGGALTPIGDPPLFLGYLRGVPFFWLLPRVIMPWLLTVGLILLVFYFFDRRSYRRMPGPIQEHHRAERETGRATGLLNLAFLAMVVMAVFLPERWFMREAVMLVAAVGSYRLTPQSVHEQNAFTFAPIREVAYLFAGIFATMMPALGYLELHGPGLGLDAPREYFLGAGSLSAVLDNAPTYASFLQLAQATAMAEDPHAFAGAREGSGIVLALLTTRPLLVIAISLGAVFFGATTYIGNGPNFMVKAIAQQAGVRCPSFFEYMVKYSLPILLPIFALVGWLFL